MNSILTEDIVAKNYKGENERLKTATKTPKGIDRGMPIVLEPPLIPANADDWEIDAKKTKKDRKTKAPSYVDPDHFGGLDE